MKFTEQEKQKIKNAVTRVEKTTSGEIVTVFVNKSDNYNEIAISISLITGVIFLIIINILSFFWLLPFKFNIANFSILQILIMGITFLIVNFIPPIKRFFLSENKKGKTVHNKANEAFINEEVFNTKGRTGILIFISKFEHIVEIIVDSGINKEFSPKDHNELIDTIIRGVKNKKTSDGIITAIHQIGNLLVKAGYSIKPDDINELKDDFITEK